MKTKKPTPSASQLSRRGLLQGATALSIGGMSAAPAAAQNLQPVPTLVQPDGKYPVVPLKRDTLRYSCVQSPTLPVDPSNARQGRRENLAYMLEVLDKIGHWSGQQDLISFHEFPIHGYAGWTRQEALAVAIEPDGPEIQALCRKAKEIGSYVTFGTYMKDRDWPDHVLMLGVLIDDSGAVIAKHWKARGGHGRGASELFTATVYDTLPRYVEMYGWDAVVPIARTPLGNIAITGVQYEPLLFATMAMKGAELVIRQATGSYPQDDVKAMAKNFGFYSAVINNSVSNGNRYFDAFANAGGTMVVDPRGEVIAAAQNVHEEFVRASIPIKSFREGRFIPDVPLDMFLPALQQYQARFAPGMHLEYLPSDMADASRYSKTKSRW
jgi:predicted amidohydrolase